MQYVGEEAVVDFLDSCLAAGTGEAIKGNGEVLMELMSLNRGGKSLRGGKWVGSGPVGRRDVHFQRRAHFDPDNLARVRRPDADEYIFPKVRDWYEKHGDWERLLEAKHSPRHSAEGPISRHVFYPVNAGETLNLRFHFTIGEMMEVSACEVKDEERRAMKRCGFALLFATPL